MRPTLSPIKITDAAAERFKSLLVKREQPPAGLRISVKAKGCSGLSYVIDYADEKGPNDEVVQDKGVTLFIDPRATMFIIGTEVDYVEDKLQSGFVFKNPNEKGRCGCGESFHV
jgi:iron-sulfur cluster assembly protein